MATTAFLTRSTAKYDHAERNLLSVLFGFAVSVIVTRWFLELTGYPQIASGDFHIAHVLWGGLLLFTAALLLLIWRGRRIQWVSSLLTGVGFGLFIDEVGKFITRSNDYFYPLAAPLIYAFFLLTVFIYIRVRDYQQDDEQADVYRVLEVLEQGVDPNLSEEEAIQIKLRLNQLAGQPAHPKAARLASSALQFLENEDVGLKSSRTSIPVRWRKRLEAAERRWLQPSRLKAFLITGFIILAMRGLLAAVGAVLFSFELSQPAGWERLTTSRWAGGEMFGLPRLILLITVLIFEAGFGFLLLTGAGLMVTQKIRRGLLFGYWGLLFSLTALYLPVLYFQQFEVITMLLLQFGLLMGVIRYRSKYLEVED